jgi:predicted RNA-binding protein with RPS1 domain/outer membrane biosynthesis protein TonB
MMAGAGRGRGRGISNAPAWQTGMDVPGPAAVAANSNNGGDGERRPGGRSYGGQPAGDRPKPTTACPEVGKIYSGCVVKTVMEYGVFVEIPSFPSHAMVHVSALSANRVDSPSDFCKSGEVFWAKVTKVEEGVDRQNRPTWKVSASFKAVDQASGKELADEGGSNDASLLTSPPVVNTIYHDCRVMSLQDYGMFIAIPGFRSHAMCHVSEITSGHLDQPSDAYSVGDTVKCKITSVEPSTDKQGRPSHKVSASVKQVDQQTGRDIDGEISRGGAASAQAGDYMNIQGSSADPAAAIFFGAGNVHLKDDGQGQFNGYDFVAADDDEPAAAGGGGGGGGKSMPKWMVEEQGAYGPSDGKADGMGYSGTEGKSSSKEKKKEKKAAKKEKKKEKKAAKKEKKKAKKERKKEKKKKEKKEKKSTSKKRGRDDSSGSDSGSDSDSDSSDSDSNSSEEEVKMSVEEARAILERESEKKRKKRKKSE